MEDMTIKSDTPQVQANAEASPEAPQPASAQTQSQPAPAPSPDLLSVLLSNPELLAKLPAIVSAVKPLLGTLSFGEQKTETQSTPAPSLPMPLPPPPPPKSEKELTAEKNAALLRAIKPFLSRERADAVDYIIKLTELAALIK